MGTDYCNYNKSVINEMINLVHKHNGIDDKYELADILAKHFRLTCARKIYSCDDFAIRFSTNKHGKKKPSNTVMSLSELQKYDNKPIFICMVSKGENELLIANSTFIDKVSHSSKSLTTTNIVGSFNYPNIIRVLGDLDNSPKNFEKLYEYHTSMSFEENLERIVDSTNGIKGKKSKEIFDKVEEEQIINSVNRSIEFVSSEDFVNLEKDLGDKVSAVEPFILMAAIVKPEKTRGAIIEYLIAGEDKSIQERIIEALVNHFTMPEFTSRNGLGDYHKSFPDFETETDIKTKIMFLNGNPKAYNIDKLLKFLSTDKSIYMVYFVGIDSNKKVVTRLVSMYDNRLLEKSYVVTHWSGRESRGSVQYEDTVLNEILNNESNCVIKKEQAVKYIKDLLDR